MEKFNYKQRVSIVWDANEHLSGANFLANFWPLKADEGKSWPFKVAQSEVGELAERWFAIN